MKPAAVTLRPYREADEAAAIELWRRTWQVAYPKLDFDARVAWWRERWRGELVPRAAITVAEQTGAREGAQEGAQDRAQHGTLVGFVTVEPATGYLDQIVVAPEHWGTPLAETLLAEARRIAPAGIELHVNTDNARAIRFYEKQGFAVVGEEKNPRSGAPIYRMRWPPGR